MPQEVVSFSFGSSVEVQGSGVTEKGQSLRNEGPLLPVRTSVKSLDAVVVKQEPSRPSVSGSLAPVAVTAARFGVQNVGPSNIGAHGVQPALDGGRGSYSQASFVPAKAPGAGVSRFSYKREVVPEAMGPQPAPSAAPAAVKSPPAPGMVRMHSHKLLLMLPRPKLEPGSAVIAPPIMKKVGAPKAKKGTWVRVLQPGAEPGSQPSLLRRVRLVPRAPRPPNSDGAPSSKPPVRKGFRTWVRVATRAGTPSARPLSARVRALKPAPRPTGAAASPGGLPGGKGKRMPSWVRGQAPSRPNAKPATTQLISVRPGQLISVLRQMRGPSGSRGTPISSLGFSGGADGLPRRLVYRRVVVPGGSGSGGALRRPSSANGKPRRLVYRRLSASGSQPARPRSASLGRKFVWDNLQTAAGKAAAQARAARLISSISRCARCFSCCENFVCLAAY